MKPKEVKEFVWGPHIVPLSDEARVQSQVPWLHSSHL